MKNRRMRSLAAVLCGAMMVSMGSVSALAETTAAAESTAEAQELADGMYIVNFDTDSGMFHANEANNGKGVLRVEEGVMTLHVSLASKKIVNLFAGLAEDAEKDGAELLMPTEDEVTYSDGATETVNGFDIPVPALGEEFPVALIGTKGKWYDHMVSVSEPTEPTEEDEAMVETAKKAAETLAKED